jgi:hypothetical protein
MLITVRYLVDRLRHGRGRAGEVAELRRGLARAEGPAGVPAAESEAAQALLGLREEMASAIGDVQSCRGCAKGHPRPHGRWDGGHCCGAPTFDLFNDDEIAALRLSGTRPGDVAPPAGDHAGCAFRGPTGCSLRAAHRPNICVRYVCPDLARELDHRGDLGRVEAIGARMEEAYNRLATLRRERQLDKELEGSDGT